MKCEVILEQNDYIMAGKIMSLVDHKAKIARTVNCTLALVFLALGIVLLAADYQGKLIVALIWGICSLFGVMTAAGFMRWNKKNARISVNVKPMTVTYSFTEAGLICMTGNQETELPWSALHRFGEKDGYLFMVFEKQQVIVIAKEKLSRSQIEEIERILHNSKIKK